VNGRETVSSKLILQLGVPVAAVGRSHDRTGVVRSCQLGGQFWLGSLTLKLMTENQSPGPHSGIPVAANVRDILICYLGFQY
jgi:hypothetical protein